MNGIFTISLDFELHWGGFEKWHLQEPGRRLRPSEVKSNYRQYFLNTRLVIPEMLKAFSEHQVHVTWATVGLLFHDNREELMANMPFQKPSLENRQLSAYHYIDQIGIGESETEDPFHYGLSLIKKISNTPHQEIGSHTFAHYYASESGQTADQFRADLQAAQRAAKKQGLVLKSLVFPRNQVNAEYLKICYDEGFTSVRTNPTDWFWNIESAGMETAWKRLNRGIDAYLNTGHKKSYATAALTQNEGEPLCLPASRLLRPYNPKELFLNRMKINRIKAEMDQAARAGEVYHLWWHPHNFGNHPAESMEGLHSILNHFTHLKNTFGMQSCSMGELTDIITGKEESVRKTGTQG